MKLDPFVHAATQATKPLIGAGFPILVLFATGGAVCAQNHPAHHHHHLHHQRGRAMIYSDKYIGKRTASGERYDPSAMTAASPSLPMGSIVEVTHEITGKSLTVRINDKAANANGLIVDLSRSAARHLGIHDTAPVSVKLVSKDGAIQ